VALFTKVNRAVFDEAEREHRQFEGEEKINDARRQLHRSQSLYLESGIRFLARRSQLVISSTDSDSVHQILNIFQVKAFWRPSY